jgi:hypothetical protein
MIAKNLAQNFKLLKNLRVSQQLLKRNVSVTEMSSPTAGTKTYEGDGKTTAQVLNKDLESGLMVNSISKIGFRLNNDMLVVGPMVIFPR